MILKFKIGLTVFLLLFFKSSGLATGYSNTNCLFDPPLPSATGEMSATVNKQDKDLTLRQLNSEFLNAISTGDTTNSRKLLKAVLKTLRETNNDNLTVSNSDYYIGVYYLFAGKYSEAINWLKLSLSMRSQSGVEDATYFKCLFNLGLAYSKTGDMRQMEKYMLQSLETETRLSGESSPSLLSVFHALITAYISLDEYLKAIAYGNKALKIINTNKGLNYSEVAAIYTNMGVCHGRLADYSKAILFLEEAESVYRINSLPEDENYINLLNSLASTYFFLGMNEKSEEYFNKGIEKIEKSNSAVSLNFMNSFAVTLGNTGNIKRGEDLMKSAVEKARRFYGENSRDYFEVVKNYADYLRTFNIDFIKSLLLYEKCIGYLNNHANDMTLRDPVFLGYSLALADNKQPGKALEIIQKLIFPSGQAKTGLLPYANPEPDQIEPVQFSINVLKAKYRILWDIYRINRNTDYLIAASETSELIISLLEKVRINISEEESRIVLGDRYRESYLFTIRDFDLCYKITGNIEYLHKAFEYSEKSKVAGLLASTRELKATQFHIPADVGELEKRLKNDISFYEARISEENQKSSPDLTLVSEWKGFVFDATQKRDSLLKMFEEKYPEYYSIKYNTSVIKPEDLPGITGRNTNYLSYVATDSNLYIFLANRKYLKLVSVPVDSSFFTSVRNFRDMLSLPIDDDARAGFSKYISTGIRLYNTIFEPVQKYLISNKLLISPDNILSYIPFEAIPVSQVPPGSLQYSNMPFMMRDFNISYTYSATLLSESLRRDHTMSNSLIAFAPVYTGRIDIDSVLKSRQASKGVLHDLKFARTEAEYVTGLTGGKLFINNRAKESVYKSEAGKYDIIHLAMHTVLNDQYPMYSKMLFYQGKDSIEDGNLNTYEVYGVPLKAKMVILSSCNTGNGILHSGEGILSLARGFIYSGSQSVVMSMWEIEDKSGAEIVTTFYKYLRTGDSKSKALRKARIEYLKKADMLRSHPYFWSSLVIYGNNEQLYPSRKPLIIAGAAALILAVSMIFYNFYRRSR